MSIKDLQHNWDAFGKQDPMWAILTSPQKQGNKWQPDEFFATGRTEIERLMAYIATLPMARPHRRALDFGCGVGRLSQALAHHVETVCGVDIAPSMIEQARAYNQHGERCTYYVNAVDNLAIFEDHSFDLIYSNITLQHIAPAYSQNYLREFVRVLMPGGVLVFQLPSAPKPQQRLKQGLKGLVPAPLLQTYRRLRHGDQPIMQMHAIPRSQIEHMLATTSARIVDIQPDIMAGPEWIAYRYCVTKDA